MLKTRAQQKGKDAVSPSEEGDSTRGGGGVVGGEKGSQPEGTLTEKERAKEVSNADLWVLDCH